MIFYRLFADTEFGGDPFVKITLRNIFQDFRFPGSGWRDESLGFIALGEFLKFVQHLFGYLGLVCQALILS